MSGISGLCSGIARLVTCGCCDDTDDEKKHISTAKKIDKKSVEAIDSFGSTVEERSEGRIGLDSF